MTRLGFLSRLLLVAVIGCNVVWFSPAQSSQSPNVSDLDRMMNEASGPGPYGPRYVNAANARGKVKAISKKEIMIVQSDGQELTFRLDHATRTAEGRTARELKTIKLTDIAAGNGVLVRFERQAGPHKDLAVFVVRVSTS
jgi:hypothetical protein